MFPWISFYVSSKRLPQELRTNTQEVWIKGNRDYFAGPGTGSNLRPKKETDWENEVLKIQKIKGWKVKKKKKKKKTLEDFSEVLNCGDLKELLISFHSHFSCILLLTRLSRGQARVWSQVWSWAQLALIWGAFHHLKTTSPHSPDFSICNSRHQTSGNDLLAFFNYPAVWGFFGLFDNCPW